MPAPSLASSKECSEAPRFSESTTYERLCRRCERSARRKDGFDDRAIELSLAHVDRNKSRASYDHSTLIEPRRHMLQQWADLIDRLSIIRKPDDAGMG